MSGVGVQKKNTFTVRTEVNWTELTKQVDPPDTRGSVSHDLLRIGWLKTAAKLGRLVLNTCIIQFVKSELQFSSVRAVIEVA